eukprot:13690839-Alexandrium_andersonii.AAC.1
MPRPSNHGGLPTAPLSSVGSLATRKVSVGDCCGPLGGVPGAPFSVGANHATKKWRSKCF